MQLESHTYAGKLGDYAWLLLFSAALLLASTALFPAYFLSDALIMVLVYVWSRANQTARVSFFGIFNVEGFYLPFVLVGWSLVTGNDPSEDIRGIVAGHVYYFLNTVWPRSGGPNLMKTPSAVTALMVWAFGGRGVVNATEFQAPRVRAFQGQGRRLNEAAPPPPAARGAWWGRAHAD